MSILTAETQAPVLASKFTPPQLLPGLVERPELVARLDLGINNHRLALVAAPAGSGKTSLAAQWRNAHPQKPTAWLALEAGDNDLLRFWQLVMQACRAEVALEMLLSDRAFSLPDILTTFIDELTGGVLVLDDFQHIRWPQIHQSLAYFIDHLPRDFHLLILTRVEPPLPLGHWRAGGEMFDLPAADLRFTREQTQFFIDRQLPATISVEAIDRLHERTGGWAAGLRLAVQGRATGEIEKFLRDFSGEYPPLLEYFATEILQTQPLSPREFLLKTGFLGRVNPALAGEVTELETSGVLLEQLEYAHLFLEKLEGEGKWYRYRPLFAEALRGLARQRFGDRGLRELARKASRWYEQNSLPDEAMEVAAGVEDYDRMGDLLEYYFTFAPQAFEIQQVRGWVEQIPESAWKARPRLCLIYAIVLLFTSDRFHPATRLRVEIPLQLAEKQWQAEENYPALGQLMAFRSCLAYFQGDYNASYEAVCKALEWLPQEEIYWRGIALTNMVPHELYDGRLNSALFLLREAHRLCVVSNNPYSKRAALFLLADVYLRRLELEQARQVYRQIYEEAVDDPSDRCATLYYLGLISFEQNDFEKAAHYVEQALELNREVADDLLQLRASLLVIRLKHLQGDLDQAAALLQMLVARSQRWPLMLREVQAYQAQLAIARGELKTARHWSAMLDGQPSEGPRTLQERESLVQARYFLARQAFPAAHNLLDGWLSEVQAQGRSASECEIWTLRALAYYAEGDLKQAAPALQEALALAQPENFRRLFLEEGQALAGLVQAALPTIKKESLAVFARSLLKELAWPETTRPALPAATQVTLPEPLSRQEQRVLRLLSEGLSNTEIANELVVSINTVKSQVKSIYRKLDINSRKEARQFI